MRSYRHVRDRGCEAGLQGHLLRRPSAGWRSGVWLGLFGLGLIQELLCCEGQLLIIDFATEIRIEAVEVLEIVLGEPYSEVFVLAPLVCKGFTRFQNLINRNVSCHTEGGQIRW